MCLADDQNVDGEGVITLAGQGSLYMCEDVKVLINVDACVFMCDGRVQLVYAVLTHCS